MPLGSAYMRPAAAVVVALLLGGCDPRDCLLGIAHSDCASHGPSLGSNLAMFPQDDAICRSYGLDPGTRDYAVCRDAKRHVRQLTERETDFGVLQEPLSPEVRPVYQVR